MKLKKAFYDKNKLWFLLFIIFTVSDDAGNLLLTYILQRITDAAVGSELGALRYLCGLSAGTLIFLLVVSMLQCVIQAKFVKRAMTQYKDVVFGRLLLKGRKTFVTEGNSLYLSGLTNDAAAIESGYLIGSGKIVAYIFSFFSTIIMMLFYSPVLTVAAIALAALPVIFSILPGDCLQAQVKLVSEKNVKFVTAFKSMLEGFSTIKSFRVEKEVQSIFARENQCVETAKYKNSLISGEIVLFSKAGGVISQIGIFLVGAYLIILGRGVTVGVLIAFVNLLGCLMTPISALPELFAHRKAAGGLIKKMEQNLSNNIETRGGEEIFNVKREICVKKLSFGYKDGVDVLQDINLKLESGKSYAIVGSSGSGKSTLLDVIMGNYDNYEGTVLYDGKEVKTLSADSRYDLFSVVQQNIFIFDGTMWDNITMFRHFDEAEVLRVVKLSGLQELWEKKGKDYECGENGCNLSGGERQRIAIARGLLCNASVFVADEATAALDAQTAYEILNEIIRIRNCMRIVITHQLDQSILGQFDKIIVMRQGQVCEQGTFKELLELKQYFYSLYNVGCQ